jgi:hypothetical protein
MAKSETPVGGSRLSRREALRRGAIVGGSLLWTTPALQTLRMSKAYAQQPSPRQVGHDISYIALNVLCTQGQMAVSYTLKYEGCSGSNCFESDPGNFPACGGVFTAAGTKADGDTLGFSATGPNAAGCVTINVPAGCTVTSSAVKGGQDCCPGPTGTGALVFCPCPPGP